MKLSDRLRPGVESAPWVIQEVEALELELENAMATAEAYRVSKEYAFADLRELQKRYNDLVDRILAGTHYTHIDDYLEARCSMEINNE